MNTYTQYKQLHTKFIHLLHKVGVGTAQNGTSISSNQRVTEATKRSVNAIDLEVLPRMAKRVATCEKAFRASGPHAP